jgi:hypothetical protein
MRTTIRLNDSLLAEVKKLAADTGRTLTGVVEDALREALARRQRPQPRTRVKLATFKGRGLQAGVDLDDSASLLDRMEGRDAVSFPVMRGADCPPHA